MTWEANRCNSCCRSRKEDWQTDVSATACVSSIASNVRAGICLVPRTHRGHVTPRSDSSLSASAATNNITATCNAMHHNTPHFSSRYRDCGPKSIGLGVIYEPLGMIGISRCGSTAKVSWRFLPILLANIPATKQNISSGQGSSSSSSGGGGVGGGGGSSGGGSGGGGGGGGSGSSGGSSSGSGRGRDRGRGSTGGGNGGSRGFVVVLT